MFLDDDAVLNGGWWEEAEPHCSDPRVGLVWGLNYDASPVRKEFLEALGVDYVGYLVRQFEKRGGTHDVLLRRDALEGIRIPPFLHVFEDAYIKNWILCRGYEYRIVKAGIIHRNPGRKMGRRGFSVMAEWGLRLGLEDARYRNPLYGLYALARTTAGVPLTVAPYVRVEGVRRGLRSGLARAWNKWYYRLVLWLKSFSVKPPRDRCEAIRRINEEWEAWV